MAEPATGLLSKSSRQRPSYWILWGLVALYAALTLINSWLIPRAVPVSILVLVPVAFALIHGALRYGWGGILAFIVIALVVSNILENFSIRTGFPFGHYHYTDGLGPKLFLVPLLIGPAYISTGYLAWVIGNVLVGDVRRGVRPFTLVATPLIAAFAMVVWDLCFDPLLSTVRRYWIWEQGGGYFGVPLSNYLGWFLTVYIFFQLFALYVRSRHPGSSERATPPRSYFAQAITMYAVVASAFVLQYLAGMSGTATDATGAVWKITNIVETSAIVSLFTMGFVAALAAVKLMRQSPSLADSAAPGATETAETINTNGATNPAQAAIAKELKTL